MLGNEEEAKLNHVFKLLKEVPIAAFGAAFNEVEWLAIKLRETNEELIRSDKELKQTYREFATFVKETNEALKKYSKEEDIQPAYVAVYRPGVPCRREHCKVCGT